MEEDRYVRCNDGSVLKYSDAFKPFLGVYAVMCREDGTPLVGLEVHEIAGPLGVTTPTQTSNVQPDVSESDLKLVADFGVNLDAGSAVSGSS